MFAGSEYTEWPSCAQKIFQDGNTVTTEKFLHSLYLFSSFENKGVNGRRKYMKRFVHIAGTALSFVEFDYAKVGNLLHRNNDSDKRF